MASVSIANGVCKSEKEKDLYNAAKSGDSKQIAELLRLNISPEAESWNRELYHRRSRYGHRVVQWQSNRSTKFSRRLLSEITVPSLMKEPRGQIPLHTAAANGHVKCLQILIDHGAKVDAKDRFHCTALHLAAENGNHECVRALSIAGADCNVATVDSVGSPYMRGTTALHLAARYNHVNCVKELLKFGADCKAIDGNGQTGLYIAAKLGFDQCVLSQLCDGRDILSFPSFDTLDTPLHFAVENRMIECVIELVRLGSDVNRINKVGFSPLLLTFCKEFWENDIVKPFVTMEVSPEWYVFKNCAVKMQILKYMVLNGRKFDINIPGRKGFTSLYHSVFVEYNPEVAIFLIAYGADTKIKQIGTNFTLLEYELSILADGRLLKFLVNCMPQLRRLGSISHAFSVLQMKQFPREKGYSVWLSSKLPENMEFQLFRDGTDIYIEMTKRKVPLSEAETFGYANDDPKSPYFSPSMRYRLEQPLVNLVQERLLDEINQLDCILGENESINSNLSYRQKLIILEKHLWYERMATNPRTLQHYCRLSVRKCMSPSKLKNIRKLPLPQKILSYLLFECDG